LTRASFDRSRCRSPASGQLASRDHSGVAPSPGRLPGGGRLGSVHRAREPRRSDAARGAHGTREL